jgi:hypothetical protein
MLSGMTKTSTISNGQIAKLTGLILSSSFPKVLQDDMIADLIEMPSYKFDELLLTLEMNQLDVTQLNNYSNSDIHKRLDYIEAREAM